MNVRAATGTIVLGLFMSGCDGNSPEAPPQDRCPVQNGEGTEHKGTIAADETWTAADGPHVVTFHLDVPASTLTIEKCATVRIGPGFHVQIGETSGDAAAIVVRGEVDAPVTFERAEDDAPWGSIRVFPTGRLDLEHATLRGGGDPLTAQSNGGIIVATGPGGNTGVTEAVRVAHVSVQDSAGFGVNFQGRAVFSEDSTDLEISGSGAMPSSGGVDTSFPIYVDGTALSTIPPGDFTGNALDEILVASVGNLRDESVTFRERGVPYRMLAGFSMGPEETLADGALSTLTIEAGVTLRFSNGAPGNTWALGLGTSNGGLPENIAAVRLIAHGTEDAPIVLTSAEEPPAPGDWAGIEWHGGPPDGNVMRYVHVEYAGGDSGTQGFGCGEPDNDAALIFRNWRPDDVFIEASTFSDSAGGGIVSGWNSDDEGPNFSGNSFTGISNGCDVSRWADADGSCPEDPPICFDGEG
jgi:hypothetical protein